MLTDVSRKVSFIKAYFSHLSQITTALLLASSTVLPATPIALEYSNFTFIITKIMDMRPSKRLSLSKRKRDERKKSRSSESEPNNKTCHIDEECPSPAEAAEASGLIESRNEAITPSSEEKKNYVEVVELLSSDEEEEPDADASVEIKTSRCVNQVVHIHDSFEEPTNDSNDACDDHVIHVPCDSNVSGSLSCGSPNTGDNSQAKDGTSKSALSYKTSAYVQNLAEIANDILHDARWRVSSKRLFQWELGDDLIALYSFGRLFIPHSTPEKEIDRDAQNLDSVISESDEVNARCLHLYARMFHRKGPWFQLSDIFGRYYHRDYLKRQEYMQQHQGEDANVSNVEETATPSISWDILEKGLQDCISDLCRLYQMGLLRTFVSEEQCGEIIGNPESKLLTAKDRLKVLHKLGGRSSENSTSSAGQNDILKQMKTQKTMLFCKKQSLLPVKKHVNDIIVATLNAKLNGLVTGSSKNQTSHQAFGISLNRIWKMVLFDLSSEIPFFTCFRLREEPLVTLRRACRIYLCAGDGSGSMRSNGSNAWIPATDPSTFFTLQRTEEKALLKGICTLPDPPNVAPWHQVVFHGLNYRMGMTFHQFTSKYIHIPLCDSLQDGDIACEDSRKYTEIFDSIAMFKMWEICAELRCTVDYLTEWNRLILYADRKIIAASKKTQEAKIDIKDRLNPCIGDDLDLMSIEGRSQLLKRLVGPCSPIEIKSLHNKIERIIQTLQRSAENEIPQGTRKGNTFLTEAEHMIASLGVVCHQALIYRLSHLPSSEIHSFTERPWLRHLFPASVIAYILWDCVETMEKRGFHHVAVQFLETILFGFQVYQEEDQWKHDNCLKWNETNPLISHVSHILLSRRVRGKAFERLLIDKKHALKTITPKKKTQKSRKMSCIVETFTLDCIPTIASTSSVPFCFIRKFSRRVKRPLLALLQNSWSVEMLELGIRLEDGDISKSGSTAYKEWAPITDTSIANSIQNDSDRGSTRCSYISNEESDEVHYIRSLNVEELAIEEYAAGRLPIDTNDEIHKQHRGGWKGWHCEGVHVRVLFRILCSDVLLGHCCNDKAVENRTIFLNPYQVAPLDLHVAHGVVHDMQSSKSVRGFYERRRKEIEAFLTKLEDMSPQDLCDLVFHSISSRIETAKKLGTRFLKDQRLCKDAQQVKTLSMLAAGFGGKVLASMFRLLSFDYRHYGAGLPDLLLVRAFTKDKEPCNSGSDKEIDTMKLLNLSDWVGEVFQKSPTNTSGILDDIDEEFLGGSLSEKQGVSSTTNNRKSNNSKAITLNDIISEKLLLTYNDAPVMVECMFVEVKSQSDKLDGRQEDWLNILDRYGSARVCKFNSSKKKR